MVRKKTNVFAFRQDRDGLPTAIVEDERFFELYGADKTATPQGWNDPKNWKALDDIAPGRPFGFAIGNSSDYLFIDFDHVIREGELVPWVKQVVDRLESAGLTYREYSISGTGLHMICDLGEYAGYFEPESNGYEQIIVDMDLSQYKALPAEERDKVPKVEFFFHTSGRYVVLTGKHDQLFEVAQDEDAAAIFHELLKIREEYHGKHGAALDAVTDQPVPLHPVSEDKQGELLGRLAYIDPACSRSDWIHVGIALFNSGFPFEVFDKWSRGDYYVRSGGAVCDKYDEKVTLTNWKSLIKSGSNWNAGTIVILSNRGGYRPPRVKSSAARDFSEDLQPEEYTDLGQASVFIGRFGETARYSTATKWLVYDGVSWRENELQAQGMAQRLTIEQLALAREQLAQARKKLDAAVEAQDDGKTELAKLEVQAAEGFRKYVLGRQKSGKIAACLTEARPSLQIDVTELDADPFLLNTPGGTVDLRTGQIREHRHDDFITKVTAVGPDDRGADLYKDFLRTVTCGDAELESYLQEVAGMAAVGKVFSENLIIPYGGGGNGKSTLFNLWYKVFGDYSAMLSSDVLTMNSRKDKVHELAELRGKRFVLAAELEEGLRLDTAVLKKVCSTDPVHAEKKYKDPFSFNPSHTTVLYTNHLPKVGTTDNGTWRRLIVIPFNARLSGQKGEIKNYAEYLFEHSGGAVLTWIIEGARRYISNGCQITPPEAVIEAVSSYRSDNDWLNNFITECCQAQKELYVGASAIYDAYVDYCLRAREYTRSRADFKAAMEVAGFTHRKRKTGAFYYGIGLRPTEFREVEKEDNCPFFGAG